ncbi:periphilin-1-like [Cololabis saira]|uniref:periphilin-1-like n=1 Tax=Cololabis saira TaxID=129043 RepID=UPI002AD48370|nr:periphilin-1-like [Cololabis saira]
MAFRGGSRSIRQAYEDHFARMDGRRVTVHRVVNVVEKRNSVARPDSEFERGFTEDQWYGSPRSYQEPRGSHSEDGYPPNDRRYFDEKPNYSSFRRNSSPSRNESSYSQQGYARDDLRHQLSSRNSGRAHHFRKRTSRGQGPGQRGDAEDYRSPKSLVITRERSPGRREAPSTVRSGSNTNRSFSPDRERGYTPKHKSGLGTSQTPASSVDGSPRSSPSSKEKTPASAVETEETAAAAASVDSKPGQEEDVKARRLEAIKSKALEIEKHYRQDCETFRTVVKMLVAKEPSLDSLLQDPLDKNLLEIKERCLDALRSFVTELDEILEQPDISE